MSDFIGTKKRAAALVLSAFLLCACTVNERAESGDAPNNTANENTGESSSETKDYVYSDDGNGETIPIDEEVGVSPNSDDPRSYSDVCGGVVEGRLSYESVISDYSNLLADNVMKQITGILEAYRNGENPLDLLPAPQSEYAEYPLSFYRPFIDWIEADSLVRHADIEENDGQKAILLDVELGHGVIMRLPMCFGQLGDSYEAYFTGIYFLDMFGDMTAQPDEDVPLRKYVLDGEDIHLPQGYVTDIDLIVTEPVDEQLVGFVRAFIEGDSTTFEELSGSESGMYAELDRLKTGRYVLYLDDLNPDESARLYIAAEITESPYDAVPTGLYCAYAEERLGYYSLTSLRG